MTMIVLAHLAQSRAMPRISGVNKLQAAKQQIHPARASKEPLGSKFVDTLLIVGRRCHISRHRSRARHAVEATAVVPESTGGGAEQRTATRVRVERQTHLPVCREEAWAALRLLVTPELWDELSGVFAGLESIYRCRIPSVRYSLVSNSH